MCKSIARVFEVERSIKDFANVLQRPWRKKEVLWLKVLEGWCLVVVELNGLKIYLSAKAVR